MCLTSVSLASLQRPLYSLIILVIYLVYIFLLKLLDLGNLKTQYKAFYLLYYLLYSYCVVRLVSLFYPKAYRNRQDFNQVIFIEYFYTNTFFQSVPCFYSSFLYLLVLQGNSNIFTSKVLTITVLQTSLRISIRTSISDFPLNPSTFSIFSYIIIIYLGITVRVELHQETDTSFTGSAPSLTCPLLYPGPCSDLIP